MKRTLKSIAPLKMGVISGIVYGLLALIFFVPFALFLALVPMMVPATAQSGQALSGAASAGIALVMAILAPVFYAACGFIFGVVGAFFYNVVAGWVGGLEFEVE